MLNIVSHLDNSNPNHSRQQPSLHPVKWELKKKKHISENMMKLESLYTSGGNVKWYSHFGKTSDNSSEN